MHYPKQITHGSAFNHFVSFNTWRKGRVIKTFQPIRGMTFTIESRGTSGVIRSHLSSSVKCAFPFSPCYFMFICFRRPHFTAATVFKWPGRVESFFFLSFLEMHTGVEN